MSKKKIIFVIVFIVLIVGGFAGYQVYENHVKEEKIAGEKITINKFYYLFQLYFPPLLLFNAFYLQQFFICHIPLSLFELIRCAK